MARLLALCLVILSASMAPANEDHYSQISPSRDGIGKVYMGREIAFTLGHRGVAWLERDERELDEQPDLLVRGLAFEADAVVADIGAGSGYFTFRIAPRIPEGKVISVDIQPEMLQEIEKRRESTGLRNVETVQGSASDPNIDNGTLDAALIVDAYHEFSHPREMMSALLEDLKPGGVLFLVEYRAEDPDVPILPLHKMTEKQARREMAAVGFEWVENRDLLPRQHVLVFRRPAR